MEWLAGSLRENPELAVFLTLAIGFVIGRSRSAGVVPSVPLRGRGARFQSGAR